eukprot:SAG31_NODE_26369_length_443_cov_1.345930_1_plen_48_part_01
MNINNTLDTNGYDVNLDSGMGMQGKMKGGTIENRCGQTTNNTSTSNRR